MGAISRTFFHSFTNNKKCLGYLEELGVTNLHLLPLFPTSGDGGFAIDDYRAVREDINRRIMHIVKEAGTGFAFPSQTAYLGRDAGLDAELGQEAETQVQAWRSKGQLPFPEFDEDMLAEKEDVLDYPPEGSPDHEPRVGESGTESGPSQEPDRKSAASRIKKAITPLRRKKT